MGISHAKQNPKAVGWRRVVSGGGGGRSDVGSVVLRRQRIVLGVACAAGCSKVATDRKKQQTYLVQSRRGGWCLDDASRDEDAGSFFL